MFENLLIDIINKMLEKVEMSFSAEIISYDKATLRATITPLLQTVINDGKGETIRMLQNIEDVPCEIIGGGGFFIRPPYQKGDIVRVSLSASNIKLAIDEKKRIDILKGRFNFSNCVITGIIKSKKSTFPGIFSTKDGLLIGENENSIHIENNKISVDTAEINLNGSDKGVARLDDTIQLDMSGIDIQALAASLLTTGAFTPSGSPPAPATVPRTFSDGKITSASSSVKAGGT